MSSTELASSSVKSQKRQNKKDKKKKKKKKDKIPDHMSSWEDVSGNVPPSQLMYFKPESMRKYDFFRLLVKKTKKAVSSAETIPPSSSSTPAVATATTSSSSTHIKVVDGITKKASDLSVDDENILRLFRFFKMERLPANVTIYHQNDIAKEMRILLCGKVKLSQETITGITHTRFLEAVGSRFGENSLGGKKVRGETAVTEEPSTFLTLTHDSHLNMTQHMPNIARDIERALDDRKESTLAEVEWLGDFAAKIVPFVKIQMVPVGEVIFGEAPSLAGDDTDGKGTYPKPTSLSTSWEKNAARDMYIVSDGRIRLHTKGGDGWEMVLRRTDVFGIHSALFGSPRFVTATATKPCVLLKIDRKSLEKATRTYPALLNVFRAKAAIVSLQYLRPSPLFSGISDEHFTEVSNLFDVEERRVGRSLCDGNGFCVLVAGQTSEKTRRTSSGAMRGRVVRGFGSWFGHKNLLGNAKRGVVSNTTTALTPCVVMALSGDNFSRFLQLLPSRSVFEDHDDNGASECASKRVAVDDLVRPPFTKVGVVDAKPRSAEDLLMSHIVATRKKSVGGSDEITWKYRDPDGNVHGPFPTSQMKDWHNNNYLLPELPIRMCMDDHDEIAKTADASFRALSEWFPEDALAFKFAPVSRVSSPPGTDAGSGKESEKTTIPHSKSF
eukprot:g4864.t1